MTQKHKILISYYTKNHENYTFYLITAYANSFFGIFFKPVEIGGIIPLGPSFTIRIQFRDNFIKHTIISIDFIGKETWKREDLDLEISLLIIQIKWNCLSRLLGILYPTFFFDYLWNNKNCKICCRYNPLTIPSRQYEIIKCGFAFFYKWENFLYIVQNLKLEPFIRRKIVSPDNNYSSFIINKSDSHKERSY